MGELLIRREIHEYNVHQAVALDLDRTLGSVKAAMARFYAAARFCGIPVEQIDEERREVESKGGTFEPLHSIEDKLTPELRHKFNYRFTTLKNPPILYDDAITFLNNLERNAMPFHLITYGVNPEWQRLKVEASGFRGGVTILDDSNKGREIAGWSSGGKYELALEGGAEKTVYRADTVCLIDDKAVAFNDLPQDCSGFLLQRGDELLASQQGSVPENVRTIHSLDELIVVNGVITPRR